MKRILFVVVVGCFLFSSCGDFLEEYSKDLVYASSCEDLDEIIIGNGYMKRNANQEYAYYRENERGVKKKVNIPWSWCDIIRALNEVFSSLVWKIDLFIVR